MNVGRARAATHERNDRGRDFVAGDIHGCYETLERALEEVRFELGRDRLFSVGDLVNRGPHSLDTLRWLEERRLHDAVLGNHEARVLTTLLNPERRVLLGWMAGIAGPLRERWIDTLWRLPLAMTVATAHGPVGIAHAGVVERSWSRTLEGLGRRDQYVISTALLGGYGADWRGRSGTPVEGLRALVTGHEPSREPTSDGFWWGIDTGAGVRGFERLTLLQVDCEPTQPHTVEVVTSERLAPTRGGGTRQAQVK